MISSLLGGYDAPADLKDRIASAKEMEQLVSGEAFKQRQRDYLR